MIIVCVARAAPLYTFQVLGGMDWPMLDDMEGWETREVASELACCGDHLNRQAFLKMT